MRTNGQGTGKIVKTKLHSHLSCFIQTVIKANLATVATLRLFFQTMHLLEILWGLIRCLDKLYLIARSFVKIRHKLLNNVGPAMVFHLRMNIGIGKINRQTCILRQVLQGICRTRRTTNVNKNARSHLFFQPLFGHLLHDTVIVDFLIGIHFR